MVAKKQLPVGAKNVPKPAAGSGKGRRVVKKKAAAGKAKRTDETEDAADEVPTADEDESLTSRGMEWRMLLASSTEGLVSEKGVSSCGSTVPMDAVPETAEYGFLEQQCLEKQRVEKACAEAKEHQDMMWFSDTVLAELKEKARARVKDLAEGVQVLAGRVHFRVWVGAGCSRE